MKRPSLSLLAVIALASPVAWLSAPASAAQETPMMGTAAPVLTEATGETFPTAEELRTHQQFDQDELAELAALESENVELQQQKAGFFGPRLGTIIIVIVLLVVLL